jgi:polyphosphate glucokinase
MSRRFDRSCHVIAALTVADWIEQYRWRNLEHWFVNGSLMNVLAIDVGGTHVKVLVSREIESRKFVSGPTLTAKQMVAGVKNIIGDWRYDAVSIGFPGPAMHNRPVAEPRNLGPGWVGFDFRSAFGCPVKLVNDAAMQALGSYRTGKMLFLGLGTGLGSSLVVDGIVEPMELGHLPYKKGTYESYVGNEALLKQGKKKWRRDVADVVARLTVALEPDEVVLGGGNSRELKELPPKCRVVDNRNAFVGGFRLWDNANQPRSMTATPDGLTVTTRKSKKESENGSTIRSQKLNAQRQATASTRRRVDLARAH